MAFNPLTVFHKNKRFWMAAILIICMISFVFCTGRGDLGDKIGKWIGRGGTPIFRLAGHNVTSQELYDLRTQRNVADHLMMRRADFAIKRLSKLILEQSQKPVTGKDNKRQEELARFMAMRMSIAERKAKPRYFDSGTKFDDLVEFKLWQAEADRLNIRLEEKEFEKLYIEEFYGAVSGDEERAAERDTRHSFSNVGEAFVRRAITEEFRVRIAQYAVLGAQPNSLLSRHQRESQGYIAKIPRQDMPDEVRAPMTPAQLWEFFKSQRAEFDVTLIPIHVKDLLDQVKEPTDIAKSVFFEKYRNKPADPSSPDWGLEIPEHIKIEYVIADPTSPAYTELAKFKLNMEVMSPFAASPMQGLLVTAARYAAAAQANRMTLDQQYQQISKRKNYHGAALYAEKDCLSPVLAWLARNHPEAGASVTAHTFLTPTDPFGALAGYLAWGAGEEVKSTTPADKDDKAVVQRKFRKNPVVEASARAEMERRAPLYATLFAASTSQFPLEMALPFLAMDDYQVRNPQFGLWTYVHPEFTVATVQHELHDMIVRQIAQEWAQANIRIVKRALDKSSGQMEHFKRDLNKLVPQLRLTYGPPDDKKNTYYNRYSVNTAKELEPLREAFERSIDLINYAEGRDVNPASLLKPGDFYKMFFEQTEPFCASSKYRAMPWPPRVKTNTSRAWKQEPDPRLIDAKNFDPNSFANFMQHLHQQDPNLAPKEFEGLFENAEKPILFWRTADILPQRPGDLAKLESDMKKKADELKKIELDRKKEQNPSTLEKLNQTAATLAKQINDLKEIQSRVTEGCKFEEARDTKAIPKAKEIAQELIKTNNSLDLIVKESDELKKRNRTLIQIPGLSLMHPEGFGTGKVDYTSNPMPKNTFDYPRDDVMQQIVSLYNLQKPLKFDYKELDEINKELFDQAAKEKKPGSFVQILTNKPHSVFYIALITKQPDANMFFFSMSMQGAPYHSNMDTFVQRAQQQQAKDFRRNIVQDLLRSFNYELVSEDARKSFDDRGVGD